MALNRTYLPAKTVETIVEDMIQESPTYVTSNPWRRGRERGFVLDVTLSDGRDFYVYICENYNSDAIKLIPAHTSRIQDITEHEWLSAIYFGPREMHQAAEKVVELLEVEEA